MTLEEAVRVEAWRMYHEGWPVEAIAQRVRLPRMLTEGHLRLAWEATDGKQVPCPCHRLTLSEAWTEAKREDKARGEAAERQAARAAARARAPEWLRRAGVPAQAVEALRLEKPTDVLVAVRRHWEADSALCLVLMGALGAGKTVAAAWVLREALVADVMTPRASGDESRRPSPGLFATAAAFLRFSPFNNEDWELRATPVLVLDELGAEATHDANRDRVHDLLCERAGRGLRTILTTNLDKKAFVTRYGTRLADRLREWGAAEVAAGPSLRRKT